MSAGNSQSDDNGRGEYFRNSDASGSSDSKVPSVLDEAIRRTIATARPQESISQEEFAVLLEVARRHAERPLELDPVVVEMVEALLTLQLSKHPDTQSAPTAGKENAEDSSSRRVMSQEIAASIYDNPFGHQRLESLWAKLKEAIT